MRPVDFIFKFILRLNAKIAVDLVYRGLLSREADVDGLLAYSKVLQRTGDLTTLLAEIGSSDEHWRNTLIARSPELVRALYQGLLGREPEAERLQAKVAKLSEDCDLTTLVAEIGSSNEHWRNTLIARSPELVRALYQGLLGREPEAERLQAKVAKLSEDCDLTTLVAEIGSSDEHWRNTLIARSPELVRALYQGLLGREPEAERLQAKVAKLSEDCDLTTLVAEIGSSDEHWRNTLIARSPELVRALYQGLLGREPEAEGLQAKVAKLSEDCDLTTLVAEIGSSDEHWRNTLIARSPELVRALYQGLLGREPEAEGLQAKVAKLSEDCDLTTLVAEIGSSDEHWRNTLIARSPELVRALYQGLLGREPEAERLQAKVAKLSEDCDLTTLVAEIGSSDEHWRNTLIARSPELVRALYQGLLGREPEAEGLQAKVAKLSEDCDLTEVPPVLVPRAF